MPEKNFLNLHVLISHNPSCLNRDDMNMQKTAVFGGVRRVRVSSQCLKRAMRESKYWTSLLGSPSVRTRELDRLKAKFKEVVSEPALREFVPEAVDRIVGRFGEKAASKSKKGKGAKKAVAEEGAASEASDNGEEKGVAVAPWSIGEVESVCRVLAAAKSDGGKNGAVDKLLKEAMEGAKEAFRHRDLDIALFGRMTTAGIMTSVDGAMSLAHVITTHKVEEDLDWFTAMDDLKDGDGQAENREDAGAGHLNTQEFGAGVFYRYASLNIKQLQENLGDAPRAKALEVASHLAHMLGSVVPTAKQHSFAAHNPAEFIMASFTAIPVSAANAFESPVRAEDGGGFIKPSVRAFEDYMGRVYAGYGLGDEQAVFSIPETKIELRVKTLLELESWIRER